MSSSITTHILDISKGTPAAGVSVILHRLTNGNWEELGRRESDANGRVADLIGEHVKLVPGEYRLTFDTGKYFSSQQVRFFHPTISVVFRVQDQSQHYHVPLLISPYGYSTYRGS